MSDAPLSFAQLAARIEALESQTRRLKRLVLAFAVGALCLGTVATSVASQRSISFTGSNGTVRISAAGFVLLDKSGHKRLTLGFNNANRPGMYLWDTNGIDRLGAYMSKDDTPVVRLTDSNNKDRAFFGLTAMEKPRLEFDDTSETERLYVGLTTEDSGLVRTYSKDDKEEIALGNELLRIYDDAGTERAYIGLSTENTSMVKLWDAHHTERNFMGEYDDGSAGASSYNSSGTATWSSP